MNILIGSIVFVQYYVYLPDHRIMAKNEVHQMSTFLNVVLLKGGDQNLWLRERKKPVINNLPL